MKPYNQGILVGRFHMGWFGRVMTVLLGAALFVVLSGFAILAVAMVIATAVVSGVRLWWQNHPARVRRENRSRDGRTLETQYEVLSSGNREHDNAGSGKRVWGTTDADT